MPTKKQLPENAEKSIAQCEKSLTNIDVTCELHEDVLMAEPSKLKVKLRRVNSPPLGATPLFSDVWIPRSLLRGFSFKFREIKDGNAK